MTEPLNYFSAAARLQYLLKTMRFSAIHAAAKSLGINASTLQSIIKRDAISRKTAELIAEKWGFAADWVERGWGPMRKDAECNTETTEPLFCTVVDPWSAGEHLRSGHDVAQQTEANSVRVERSGLAFAMIPKAKAKLSAGGGIVPEEGSTGDDYAFRLDWLKAVASSPRNVILVDVDGDSMIPSLMDKDRVLIDLGRTELRDGRIYAIAVGDVVQIKRLQRLTADRIRIISDNPSYYTYEARPDELRIIGQAIWYGRSLI